MATHRGVPDDSSHTARRIGSITPRLAATPEYLARQGIPEAPADLSKHECIRFGADRTDDYWPITDTDGIAQKIPIGGRLIVHDIITLYTAMRTGLGIGVLPESALRKAEEEGTLTEVLPGCRIESNELYVLIPIGTERLPRVRVFVDWLTAFMETLELSTIT